MEAALESNPLQTTVTRLLGELQRGSDAAVDELFTLLYDELRELAHRQRLRWRDDFTLDTTALVHEAYLKLVGPTGTEVESRAHFLALAARAMRHILCNYARDRRALKRGGGLERLPLDEAVALPDPATPTDDLADTLVSLDEALKRLEQLDPRQGKVVECRFFGGLTVAETAIALGVSPRTVKRDWVVAQAWLHHEMTART
jgi:RNA polymerase sigma factor (TIGR02999 family)